MTQLEPHTNEPQAVCLAQGGHPDNKQSSMTLQPPAKGSLGHPTSERSQSWFITHGQWNFLHSTEDKYVMCAKVVCILPKCQRTIRMSPPHGTYAHTRTCMHT